MKLSKHDLMLLELWSLDKTETYIYNHPGADMRKVSKRNGEIPPVGGCFKTPREFIEDSFGDNFGVALAAFNAKRGGKR